MHKKRSPDIQETELYDKITKLETTIIGHISQMKKNKKYYQCKHYMNMEEQCQQYDANNNYYDKFWKMFLMNEICMTRINDMKQYVEEYSEQLAQVQNLLQKHQSIVSSKCKKKMRRTAEQIEKQYNCPYGKCYKAYGSEVSLNLHMKLKHNGGSKSDREKAAELIKQALEKNQPIPQFRINLPPRFIELIKFDQNPKKQRNNQVNNQQQNNEEQPFIQESSQNNKNRKMK